MDEKGYTLKGVLLAGAEVISMATSALALAADLFGLGFNIDWRVIALIAQIIFAVLVWYHIIRLNAILSSKIPKVRMIKPFMTPGHIHGLKPLVVSPSGSTSISKDTYFAHTGFVNVPKHPTEQNHAEGVVASLTYYGVNGNVLVDTIQGRWSKSDPPKEERDLQQIIRRQIKSDGVVEYLDIACKVKGDDSWYAFNNDSYFFQDMVDHRFELAEPIVDVHIKLSGGRVRENFKLRLYNEGRNGGIRIEERESWLKRLISRKGRKD